MCHIHLKAAKYEIQKPSTWRATLFSCKFSWMFPVFHLAWSTCRGLKKVVAKSREWVYFEQHILALLLVFHQTHNLSRNKFARALANQPIRAPHFFNLQQMFWLRFKLNMQGEKWETSTKTCKETMLRNKLRTFVSRISVPSPAEVGAPRDLTVPISSEVPHCGVGVNSSWKLKTLQRFPRLMGAREAPLG